MKGLAEVDQTQMELLRQIANDLAISVKVAVLLVGIVGLLPDDSGGHEIDFDMAVKELVDDGGIELVELVGVGAGTG